MGEKSVDGLQHGGAHAGVDGAGGENAGENSRNAAFYLAVKEEINMLNIQIFHFVNRRTFNRFRFQIYLFVPTATRSTATRFRVLKLIYVFSLEKLTDSQAAKSL